MSQHVNATFVGSPVIPARVINIAVDTAYLYSQPGGPYAGRGIYMMDNNVLGGSGGQGSEELCSQVTAGFGIGFKHKDRKYNSVFLKTLPLGMVNRSLSMACWLRRSCLHAMSGALLCGRAPRATEEGGRCVATRAILAAHL